jgi:hypothetical protein
LRLANRDLHSEYDGPFEIVSMTGTVSFHGSHLHISISDENGKTIGGHLVFGCKIYTTAEMVIAVLEDEVYTLHGHTPALAGGARELRLFDGVENAICDRGYYINVSSQKIRGMKSWLYTISNDVARDVIPHTFN